MSNKKRFLEIYKRFTVECLNTFRGFLVSSLFVNFIIIIMEFNFLADTLKLILNKYKLVVNLINGSCYNLLSWKMITKQSSIGIIVKIITLVLIMTVWKFSEKNLLDINLMETSLAETDTETEQKRIESSQQHLVKWGQMVIMLSFIFGCFLFLAIKIAVLMDGFEKLVDALGETIAHEVQQIDKNIQALDIDDLEHRVDILETNVKILTEFLKKHGNE